MILVLCKYPEYPPDRPRHRLNDNIYDAASAGTEFPIDVDLIDRVEVIRGPNSSLYIASSFLGVINIITKRGQGLQKLSVSGTAASYGTYQGRVSYGNKFSNGLEVLLSGSFCDSHGQDRLFFQEFDNPATNNGIAVNADDDQFHQFFADVSWGHFILYGVFGSRDKGIPTASSGTVFAVTGTRTIDERAYLDLYFDQFNNDGTYVYDYSASGGPSRVLNKNYAHGKWWGDEVTLSKQIFETQRLSVGFEYRNNFEQSQGNYDFHPFVQYSSDYKTSDIFSVYAQGEIHLRKNLVLNLGLRYDHYSTFGGATNPRAALIFNPWEKTTFKFLYGQSFRAPNLFELFYVARGNEANPSLRPETVETMELCDLVNWIVRRSIGCLDSDGQCVKMRALQIQPIGNRLSSSVNRLWPLRDVGFMPPHRESVQIDEGGSGSDGFGALRAPATNFVRFTRVCWMLPTNPYFFGGTNWESDHLHPPIKGYSAPKGSMSFSADFRSKGINA